jgi:sugar lactone lactonase YvrE
MPWCASSQTYAISTIAGGALPVGMPGTSASLSPLSYIAADPAGNVFFVDQNTVLRLDATTGVLNVVAGAGTTGFSGDNGPATSAQLNGPTGVAVDAAGNLFIADTLNNVVRKVSNGVITTVAGNGTQGFSGDNGAATSAQLNEPTGVAVDSAGNLYIADEGNNVIREVSNGMIATVAGNGTLGFSGDSGPATGAQLNGPTGVAVDSAGNLYIADPGNQRIRMVSNGMIATVAGKGIPAGFSGDNGAATSAQLNWPTGVAVDAAGNLYIADEGNNVIRKVSNGMIATVAGNGTQGFSGDNGPPGGAQLAGPWGVAVDSAGNLYIAD